VPARSFKERRLRLGLPAKVDLDRNIKPENPFPRKPQFGVATAEQVHVSEVEIQYATRSRPYVHAERVERGDIARPGGRRFGALVHAVLATIDLDASADAVHASATINGRIVSATEEEVQAAIVTVGTALGHPILRRAAASAGKGGLRRETPVLLTLDDGSLSEGVVDLAFREDTPDFAGWTVVDFKTDREFAVSSARYIAQVRVYSEAVGAATGSPARGIVLVL
jgi:ATP-dependent helicase/nuclease subunit A